MTFLWPPLRITQAAAASYKGPIMIIHRAPLYTGAFPMFIGTTKNQTLNTSQLWHFTHVYSCSEPMQVSGCMGVCPHVTPRLQMCFTTLSLHVRALLPAGQEQRLGCCAC